MSIVNNISNDKLNLRKEKFNTFEKLLQSYSSLNYPIDINGIKVINFGKIDERNNFQTPIQIYPIGYKCEIIVDDTYSRSRRRRSSSAPTTQTIECEIIVINNSPQFIISNKETDQIYIGKTELDAWKKFDSNYSYNNNQNLSFFNLDIELAIEGLNNSINLNIYEFHYERGYGELYTTNEELIIKKIEYYDELLKENDDENDFEYIKEQKELEKEQIRLAQLKLKERKEFEKEELRKKKLYLIENAKSIKEEKEKLKIEEKKKLKTQLFTNKIFKEKNKIQDDYKKQFIKELNETLSKRRIESTSKVFQYYDCEQTEIDENESRNFNNKHFISNIENKETLSSIYNLDELIDIAPTCSEVFNTVNIEKNNTINWDELLQISHSCSVFKNHLKVNLPGSDLKDIVTNFDVFYSSLDSSCNNFNNNNDYFSESDYDDTFDDDDDDDDDNNNDDNDNNDKMTIIITHNEITEDSLIKNIIENESDKKNNNSQDIIIDEMIIDNLSEKSSSDIISTCINDLNQSNINDNNKIMEEMVVDIIETPCLDISISNSSSEIIQSESNVNEITTNIKEEIKEEVQKTSTKIIPSISRRQMEHNNAMLRRWNEIEHSIMGFDRLNLGLVRILSIDLLQLFEIDEVVDESNKNRDKKGNLIITSTKFPLNQLTWMELARMGLLNYSLQELNIPKEDIRACIRGNNSMYYRSNKTIIQNIRKRIALRLENSSQFPFPFDSIFNQSNDKDFKISSPPSLDNSFTSEIELISQLEEMFTTTDEIYPEIYLRCCRVLLKVLKINISKSFLWEVDVEYYPDYYMTISRPVMFVNIATALKNKKYGYISDDYDLASTDGVIPTMSLENELDIINLFINDMKAVVMNCYTFNTELTILTAHAQKLSHIINRHIESWILDINRPSLSMCNEQYCMLSKKLIPNNTKEDLFSIKCEQCYGVFSIQELEEIMGNDSLFLPTLQQCQLVGGHDDEWLCPFCLKDQNKNTTSSSTYDNFPTNHYGPSSSIPWQLNKNYNKIFKQICEENVSMNSIFKSLTYLSSSDGMNSSVIDTNSLYNSPQEQSIKSIKNTWSINERITVIKSICEAIKSSTSSIEAANKIYNEHQKLTKIAESESFRKTEFVSTMNEICHDEGLNICRNILDIYKDGLTEQLGFTDYFMGNGDTKYNKFCKLCNESTWTPECSDSNIAICEICADEFHLLCVGNNLKAIPKNFQCNSCKSGDKKNNVSNTNDLYIYRDIELENEYINNICQLKSEKAVASYIEAGGTDSKFNLSQIHVDNNDSNILCEYCGMNELDMCSPFVLAQSRAEHDACIEMCNPVLKANGYIIDDTLNVPPTIKFYSDSNKISPLEYKVPYFPLYNTIECDELINKSIELNIQPRIVHQYCALQMFNIRMNKKKNSKKIKRIQISQRSLPISGLSIKSLGVDNEGREYWKFPLSNYLYINIDNHLDAEKKAFLKLIGRDIIETNNSSEMNNNNQKWKVLTTIDEIRKIVDLLGYSRNEESLRQEIILTLSVDQYSYSTIPTAKEIAEKVLKDAQDLAIELENRKQEEELLNDSKEDIEEVIDTSLPPVVSSSSRLSLTSRQSTVLASKPKVKPLPNPKDLIPASLKLMLSKGQSVVPLQNIKQEVAFEDINLIEDGADQSYLDYLTFQKGRYYAIAIVNNLDKKLKINPNTVVVTYQIFVEGTSRPIVYSALTEPFGNDSIFYFMIPVFKRAGNYTIQFSVEGEGMNSLSPLSYFVKAESNSLKYGSSNALDQLRAIQHLSTPNRYYLYRNKNKHYNKITQNLTITCSELEAVKTSIFLLFYALPEGSLTLETEFDDNNYGSNSNMVIDRNIIRDKIINTKGWNENIEQTWKDLVDSTSDPTILMECILLLEYYIKKEWYLPSHVKLLQVLPPYHFAIRSVSLSSISLRVYCLDKAIDYKKIFIPPRHSRKSNVSDTNNSNSSSIDTSLSNRRNDVDNSKSENTLGRSRRISNASINYEYTTYKEDEDNNKKRSIRSEAKSKVGRPTKIPKFDDMDTANDDDNYDDEDNDDVEDNDDLMYTDAIGNDYEDNVKKSGGWKGGVRVPKGRGRGRPPKGEAVIINTPEQIIDIINYNKSLINYRFNDSINNLISIFNRVTDENEKNYTSIKIRYLLILRNFQLNITTSIFWTPVDLSIITDYLEIVATPMDLGYITYSVDRGDYNEDINLFAKDIRQVFINAMKYNAIGTEIFNIAKVLAFQFESDFHHLFLSNNQIPVSDISLNGNIPNSFQPITLLSSNGQEKIIDSLDQDNSIDSNINIDVAVNQVAIHVEEQMKNEIIIPVENRNDEIMTNEVN